MLKLNSMNVGDVIHTHTYVNISMYVRMHASIYIVGMYVYIACQEKGYAL